MQISDNKQLEKLKLTLLCGKKALHLILYDNTQKKQTTRYSLSPPRHAAIYLQRLHLHTSPPHLLINPLKCSSDISDLSSSKCQLKNLILTKALHINPCSNTVGFNFQTSCICK